MTGRETKYKKNLYKQQNPLKNFPGKTSNKWILFHPNTFFFLLNITVFIFGNLYLHKAIALKNRPLINWVN